MAEHIKQSKSGTPPGSQDPEKVADEVGMAGQAELPVHWAKGLPIWDQVVNTLCLGYEPSHVYDHQLAWLEPDERIELIKAAHEEATLRGISPYPPTWITEEDRRREADRAQTAAKDKAAISEWAEETIAALIELYRKNGRFGEFRDAINQTYGDGRLHLSSPLEGLVIRLAESPEVEEDPYAAGRKRWAHLNAVDVNELKPQPQEYLVEGLILRNGLNLLSGPAKEGKSTLLTYLLKEMQWGGSFCGLTVRPARAVILTEEGQRSWEERLQWVKPRGRYEVITQPFTGKPPLERFTRYVHEIAQYCQERGAELVVFDTLAKLTPAGTEMNSDAAEEVMSILRVLNKAGVTVVILHHHGHNAERARGTSALGAAVDVCINVNKVRGCPKKCRRRRIHTDGRSVNLVGELLIEFAEDRSGYRVFTPEETTPAEADGEDTRSNREIIHEILPEASPGWTWETVQEHWPRETRPGKATLLEELQAGADEGVWNREGKGVRGSPLTFWRSAP